MKTLLLIPVFVLVACGHNNEQTTVLNNNTPERAKQANRSESEENFGIVGKTATMMGSFSTLVNPSTKAVPSGAPLAYGSVSTFTDAVTKNKCAGAFAYEPDPLSPTTQAMLFFYTATHCFETVNSLGMTTSAVGKSVLSQVSLAAGIGFKAPFAALNTQPQIISTGTPAIQHEGKTRTDVIRFLQRRLPLSEAKQIALPTCRSSTTVPLDRGLVAGVLAVDKSGILQAHSKDWVKLKAGNALDAEPLRIANSGLGTMYLLEALGTIPGESGSPVWLIEGGRDVATSQSFHCLQGVISREVITPTLQANGSYELEINSYFTPILPSGSGVVWNRVQ